MADNGAFLSQVQIFAFSYSPRGWAKCNGQLLPINQNQALFSLLGTTYGGNGQTNFALPDLRGKLAMHFGAGFTLGQAGGQEAHTITMGEMPAHTHQVTASSNGPTANTPAGNFFATNTGFTAYGNASLVGMAADSTTSIGGNQAHQNMSPFLTMNFCISLQGIFPSPN